MTEDTHSVLVVTKDSKLSQSISVMLIPPLFETEVLSDFNEARRRVAERSYNIILVDYSEGEGADFATDVSEGLATILLLTPPSLFEEVSYRVEGYGIIAITNPFDQFYFYNMIKAAIAVQSEDPHWYRCMEHRFPFCRLRPLSSCGRRCRL